MIHRIATNNKYIIDCIVSSKPERELLDICYKNKSKQHPFPTLFKNLTELCRNEKIVKANYLRFFICTGPRHSIYVLNHIISSLSVDQVNSSRFLVENPASSNDADLRLLVRLLQANANQIYFNYPYIGANLNCNINRKYTEYDTCKISIYSKHLYNRPHEKLLDYVPHFVSLLDILYGNSLINAIISSPVVSSFKAYGRVSEIGLCVNNYNLIFRYGEHLDQVNRISLISRELRKTIHTRIGTIFTNPIDMNMIRFMTDKTITDTLISDSKYELASHSIVNACKKLRKRNHIE